MTLNIGNIFLLAERLDSLSPDERFGMWNCEWCVSGYANRLSGERFASFNTAAEWLGLSEQDVKPLFLPLAYTMSPEQRALLAKAFGHDILIYVATAPQAARVLRHLAITGKVDWTVAFAQEPELPKPPALILEEQRK